jgi:antitoxin HigA-1
MNLKNDAALPGFEPDHPGVILLAEYLQPHAITQKRLADALGYTPETVSNLIKGKRNITERIALDLADVFDTSPQYWLNLQMTWALWHEKTKHQPKQRLAKRLSA